MSWHRFAASNDAGTCCWCGRTLRQKYFTRTERVEKPLDAIGVMTCRHCQATCSLNRHGYCDRCGRYTDIHTRRVIERTKQYEAPGDYGDGFFCGLRCAYQFAVSLAKAGRRLQPKEVA